MPAGGISVQTEYLFSVKIFSDSDAASLSLCPIRTYKYTRTHPVLSPTLLRTSSPDVALDNDGDDDTNNDDDSKDAWNYDGHAITLVHPPQYG